MSRRTIHVCDRCDNEFVSTMPPEFDTESLDAVTVTVRTNEGLAFAVGAAPDFSRKTLCPVRRGFEDLCQKCEKAVAGYLARIFKVTLPKEAGGDPPESTDEQDKPEARIKVTVDLGDGQPLIGSSTGIKVHDEPDADPPPAAEAGEDPPIPGVYSEITADTDGTIADDESKPK